MNLCSNFWSRLLKLAFVLLTASLLTGCMNRPTIRYVEWDPAQAGAFKLNTWEKYEDEGYWFTSQYSSVVIAEYERVTGQEVDTLPLHMYGFHLWFDGTLYHLTQTQKQ